MSRTCALLLQQAGPQLCTTFTTLPLLTGITVLPPLNPEGSFTQPLRELRNAPEPAQLIAPTSAPASALTFTQQATALRIPPQTGRTRAWHYSPSSAPVQHHPVPPIHQHGRNLWHNLGSPHPKHELCLTGIHELVSRHFNKPLRGSGSLPRMDVRLLRTSSGAGHTHPPLPGVLAFLPPAAVPYAQLMRLDKPIGTWLLLWPSLWSIALAAPPGQLPDPYMSALFAAGALLLRGAGCTINDLWDRDLDAKVERTRTRPLASGALKPAHAVGTAAPELCGEGNKKIAFVNRVIIAGGILSQLLGASSLLLVATYPLMKRVTYWPQAYLGLTINWGAILGWAAVRGSCDVAVVLPLYLSGVCWSIVYDTIYAHQDTKDDLNAGVRSTALLFGNNTKPILTGFAAVQLASLCAAGAAADVSGAFYGGVAGLAAHLTWQLARVDLRNGPLCAETFVSNKWAGAIVFLGCVAGRVLS